jgi:hypothetical protein
VARRITYIGSVLIAVGLLGSEIFCGSRREWLWGLLCQLTLLAGFVVGTSSIMLLRRQDQRGLFGLIIAIFSIIWVIPFSSVGWHGIVSRVTAPDGTEMCVIETPGGETRQTGFYYRRPGQRWGWFYYEHEDSHWWFGRIRLSSDGTRAVLYRFVLPVAYFDIPTERFTIARWDRTLGPAQRWMPEDWRPEDALKLPGPPFSPMEFGAENDQPPDMKNVPP